MWTGFVPPFRLPKMPAKMLKKAMGTMKLRDKAPRSRRRFMKPVRMIERIMSALPSFAKLPPGKVKEHRLQIGGPEGEVPHLDGCPAGRLQNPGDLRGRIGDAEPERRGRRGLSDRSSPLRRG